MILLSNRTDLGVAHFDPEYLAHFDPFLVAHFNPLYVVQYVRILQPKIEMYLLSTSKI